MSGGGCCGPFVPGSDGGGGGGGDGGVALGAGTQSASSGTVSFANSNGISFGMSGSSQITASFDGIRSISGGTTHALGPGVSFANSNNVSFGLNGSTVTASISTAPETPFALAAGTQSVSTGTISFANSNGITFGMAGSNQITASFSDFTYLNNYVNWLGKSVVMKNPNQSSIFIHPVTLPNMSWSLLGVLLNATNNVLSVGTLTYSHGLAVYSKSNASLSLVMSTSFSVSVAYSTDASQSLYDGIRVFSTPWTSSLSKGDYWFAVHQMSTTSSQNASIRVGFVDCPIVASTFSGSFGVVTNQTAQMALGHGYYSNQTAAFPVSIAFSQIRGTATPGGNQLALAGINLGQSV